MAKQELATWEDAVKSIAPRYNRTASIDTLKWSQEKNFITSVVRSNKDLRAAKPESLAAAFLQAAAMGLSFNPVLKHCYLIPRKARRGDPKAPIIAYASPSYMGLIHIAVESGSATAVAAEVVYKADRFEYRGPLEKPEHIPTLDNTKREENLAIGAYALARLSDGTWRCEYLDRQTIMKIKDMSEMKGGTMWNPKKLWTEGWKKAAIRRMVKTMPNALGARMQSAVSVLDQFEGILNSTERVATKDVQATIIMSEDQIVELTDLANEAGILPERVASVFGVATIADIPGERYSEAKQRLTNAKNSKKPEVANG